jgi:hypothetical protein
VSVARIARIYKPWGATEIGILGVVLQRAVSRILLEGEEPIESDLLDGAIIRFGLSRSALANNCAGIRSVRGVREEISPVVVRTTFRMCSVDEFSIAEAAQSLGIVKTTLKS